MRIIPKVKKNLKVSMQMSRSSNDMFYLRLEDETSGLLIAEVKLDSDAFADLMSTRTTKYLDAEYYHNDSIGKKLEVTTVSLPLKDSNTENMEDLFKRAEKEHKGWVCDRDAYSSHRYDYNEKLYAVTLRRYV